jgi:hypothetical protein
MEWTGKEMLSFVCLREKNQRAKRGSNILPSPQRSFNGVGGLYLPFIVVGPRNRRRGETVRK